ncbi:MAG: YwmB family TATA-box binding protein [Firmicutes bacterium]|nr:YwmB family TATA-box binding protein [Bacillota bacterium]
MKKLGALVALLGMFGSYTSGQALAHAVHPEEGAPIPYVQAAFNATKAKLTGYEVHDWTTINDTFMSEPAVTALSHTLAQKLQVTDMHLYPHVDDRDHVALWSGSVRGLKATVEVASMDIPGAPQTVIVLRLVESGGDEATFATSYAAIRSAILSVGGTLEENATLFGDLPGALSGTTREQVIKAAFDRAGAEELQPMQSPYTTSVAGYGAKDIPQEQAGKQAINLQVALHANRYNNVTRVLVGSPIITVEY